MIHEAYTRVCGSFSGVGSVDCLVKRWGSSKALGATVKGFGTSVSLSALHTRVEGNPYTGVLHHANVAGLGHLQRGRHHCSQAPQI